MIATIIMVGVALAWLMRESAWLTINLMGRVAWYDWQALRDTDPALELLEDYEPDECQDWQETIEPTADEMAEYKEYCRQAETEGLQEYLNNEPANQYVNLAKTRGADKGEISTIGLAQFRKLNGDRPLNSSLTPDGQHVRWEYALDQKATELGYKDAETFKASIEACLQARNKIKELEAV